MRIRDPGWRQFGSGIRDGKKSDPGSGIRDKHPGSATLVAGELFSEFANFHFDIAFSELDNFPFDVAGAHFAV